MIRRFNQALAFRSLWAFFLSLAGYAMAAGFVWLFLLLMGDTLHVQNWWLPAGIVGFWGVVTSSGWRRWRSGLSYYGAVDALGFLDLDESHGGALLVQNRSAQVTGIAYALSQVFLSGPLQALKAVSLLRARLPEDVLTEERLKDLLEGIRAKGSWHSIDTWAGREGDVSALIRMGMVEFSSTKGRLRASP
ncbi:hypothetical protein [Luteolibacter sp. LG18]|uniref:hypothetical protein n=1 Tax=Luteolibacter sp. LG18 TaxID=2819286 RepID=UPI0030C74A49